MKITLSYLPECDCQGDTCPINFTFEFDRAFSVICSLFQLQLRLFEYFYLLTSTYLSLIPICLSITQILLKSDNN